MSFSQTFEEFLEEIRSHNMNGLLRFLKKNESIRILLPDGVPITSYEKFVESQKSYFENPEALFDYEIISTTESECIGFGVCAAKVKVPMENQIKKLDLQICFLFKKIEDAWILVFDQNSELKKP
ncbi:MAG: nuclear transport factor 2 family protein [Bdellovibrionales bacterium]|nr:nuclear transport factor 2 family protein [Bdellovibrionales bacterium]